MTAAGSAGARPPAIPDVSAPVADASPAGRAPFGRRLAAAVAARGPLCVGIDPHPALLRDWGVGVDLAGLERFALTAVEAVADRIAVVKPQSAFFEQYGSRGIAVLERVLAAARAAGALVLLDVKRGDIGSTVAAYAAAYLDPASPLCADAVTASPYLGFGSLRPLLDLARATGGGVFVLALTSNPEGAAVQRAVGPDGRTVAQTVLDAAAAENATELGTGAVGLQPVGPGSEALGSAARGSEAPGSEARKSVGLGSVGVVIGATVGATGHDLSALRGPVLAPGVGAQGAGFADLPTVLGPALPWGLPSVSRELLRHGPSVPALRQATQRMAAEARAVVTVR